MDLSIHDNSLISYEVQCEARTILLRTEYRVANKLTEFTYVTSQDVVSVRRMFSRLHTRV